MTETAATEVVAAAGAGRMGRGLAVVFAYAGHPVKLVDLKERDDSPAWLAEAERDVRGILGMLVDCGMIGTEAVDLIAARVDYVDAAHAPVALAASDVIFEGVPETLEAKREALGFISAHAAPGAIIASTTSTILSDELQGMVTGPARFLNAHWLNPAFLVPLVEVSPGAETDPEVTRRLVTLLEGIGKIPVVCKASPGFIVPRIQALAMNEAARLYEEGVASAEDIDKATLFGLGFRFAILGMLEFIDWGGGDILHYASQPLHGRRDGREALRGARDHRTQHGRRPHRAQDRRRLPGLRRRRYRRLSARAALAVRRDAASHGPAAPAVALSSARLQIASFSRFACVRPPPSGNHGAIGSPFACMMSRSR